MELRIRNFKIKKKLNTKTKTKTKKIKNQRKIFLVTEYAKREAKKTKAKKEIRKVKFKIKNTI